MKITVTEVIQSRNGVDGPVEVSWGKDITPLNAASNVAAVIQRAAERDEVDPDLPIQMQYRTLSVSLTFDYTEEA